MQFLCVSFILYRMKQGIQCVFCVLLVVFQTVAFLSLNLLLKRYDVVFRIKKGHFSTLSTRGLQYRRQHTPSRSKNRTVASIRNNFAINLENTRHLYSDNESHSGTLSKHRVKVIVAVLSAPIRFDRREGIRRTWMQDCASPDILCRFFTDSLTDMTPNEKQFLVNESLRHGDIEFMPIPKGYNFGRRILWLIEWSSEHYEFDFFLRMDDDYFLCVKRLLFELPFRAQKRLYWGHIHCAVEGLVRADEGFLLLSKGLVDEFLSRRDKLVCHPFGDQQVALWMNDVKDGVYFHDPRVVNEVTARMPELKQLQQICRTYLALHGSYLHEMLSYWEIREKEKGNGYWVPSIEPFSNICPLNKTFDWRAMGGPPYGWEPKPCVLKPVWNIYHVHRGRNGM